MGNAQERSYRDAWEGNPAGGEARARGQGQSWPRLWKSSGALTRGTRERGVADGGPQ
jgi:hypothetical protein